MVDGRRRRLLLVILAAACVVGTTDASATSGNDTITTFAGTSGGFSGDGGPATAAKLDGPTAVAVDGKGNVYIADINNNRVRRVGPDGTITTIAGTGVGGFSGDGGPATSAQLFAPEGVAVDGQGTVYIADRNNGLVRKIGPNGVITTFAGTMSARSGIGDGGPATSAVLLAPDAVAVDGRGNVYIADRDHNRVRKVGPDGTITTIAGTGAAASTGDGGPATSAAVLQPARVAVDGKGDVFISHQNIVRKVDAAGTITRFAGDPGLGASSFLRGLAVDRSGNVYVSDFARYRVFKVSSDGTMTTVAGGGKGPCCLSGDGGPGALAQLEYPDGLAVDGQGSLYIADFGNNRIRKVSPTAQPAGTTKALTMFARSIEVDLTQMASGRARLKSALGSVANCSLAPAAASAQVGSVRQNRLRILDRLRKLSTPSSQAARIGALLQSALVHSVGADQHYRDWLISLERTPPCETPRNQYLTSAQREDRLASAAKRRFLATFNPLARRLHLRTWSADAI
jgi:sugar lactone lactonase YvrE